MDAVLSLIASLLTLALAIYLAKVAFARHRYRGRESQERVSRLRLLFAGLLGLVVTVALILLSEQFGESGRIAVQFLILGLLLAGIYLYVVRTSRPK